MAYLLDANVLIAAKRDHYRFSTFPCFWSYIEKRAADGTLTSVAAVRRELVDKKDELSTWVADMCPAGLFEDPDGATGVAMSRLATWVMSPSRIYTPAARAQFLAVADSVIVAHSLAHNHTVVTLEKPEPNSKKRVKIPDACMAMGVPWVSCYQMLEDLGARF